MRDLIGKTKMKKSSLPPKVRVKKTNIFDPEKVPTEFNRLFANVASILAKQIQES